MNNVDLKTFRLTVLILCTLGLVGCGQHQNQQEKRPSPSTLAPNSPIAQYYQCEEDVAEQVLIVSFVIPGVLDKTNEIRVPFRQTDPGISGFGGGGISWNSGGTTGGLNGYIAIQSSTPNSLLLKIELDWSLHESKDRIVDLIEIPLGQTGQKKFSQGQKIKWQFVLPEQASLN
ncbi:MAG: hypothetical protein GY818_21955 [Planctomycetaceae bacterium]|nr:hypothetical protein [Planctomycetaceae bacterium]